MNKEELNELFGITEDDSQEGVVDPEEGDVTDEGTDPDESDDPDEEDELDEEENLDEEDELEEEDVEEPATPRQTPEENHNYAAARRAAEAELREAQQKQTAAETERDALIDTLKGLGYEGGVQGIIDALKAQAEGREITEVSAEREAKEKEIADALANHPEIIAARAEKKAAIIQQQQVELKTIQAKNPDIKSIGQLMNLEGNAGTAFRALIREGMHIDKAYEVIEGMLEKKPPQAKPDTKAHIKQVNGTKNTPSVEIPRKQLELAQAMMPGVSKKEIQKYYEKHAES